MFKKYEPEQFQKLTEALPEELKEAIFSMETAEAISGACEKYGVVDERAGIIADLTGQVLLGVIPSSEFIRNIQEETKLPEVLAKAIGQEINRFVFYPVKPSLDKFIEMSTDVSEEKQRIEILTQEEKQAGVTKIKNKPISPKRGKELTEEKEGQTGKDIYRESIE